MNEPITYASAGVNIEAGNEVVQRIKSHVARTKIPGVLGGIGGFGGLFQPDLAGYSEPVFVSGADGVGTKLKLAFQLNKHDTVGIDLVAMCVNDVLCGGAKPLFFLDYFATGKLEVEVAENVVKGIADGCVQAGCALVGGETAELPGFYETGEYDLAGFCVGLVDKSKIIDGTSIAPGDVILGLPSSGLHSNGFSLARKVLEPLGYETIDSSLHSSLGQALLEPTRIYVKPVLSLLENVPVKGMIHITGGGFYENIPRVMPQNTRAVIHKNSWPILPLFQMLQEQADIAEREMFTTFNMGIGFIIIVAPQDAENAKTHLEAQGETVYQLGIIEAGESDAHVVLQ